MLSHTMLSKRYQSLGRRCWWFQEKVGIPMLNAVLAVEGLMKVGRGGNDLLLSFARIAAWC